MDCQTIWRTSDGFCSPECSDGQIYNVSQSRCLDGTPVKLEPGKGGLEVGFRFSVTHGAYEGTVLAAKEALDGYDNACTTRQDDALTVTRLVAIMLAIPVHEVHGLSAEGASPMTLSRADDVDTRSGNINLYSHSDWKRGDGYERAHWNPGVGMWQIDETFTETKYNHAERANTAIGGLLVANHLRDSYCRGSTSTASKMQLKDALESWYGCRPTRLDPTTDKCFKTYEKIFESNPEYLKVVKVPGSDIDGGVQDRSCRWGPSGKIFKCYLYNVDKKAGYREGDMPDYDAEGNGKHSPTPLAAPFISFTDPDTKIRYAVFPRSKALYGIHDKTIIKAAAVDTDARDSKLGPNGNGWYDNTVNGKALYVNCRISGLTQLGTHCTWENTNDES